MSLSTQIERVYRNLHPDYQKAFERDQFNSFQELLRLCTAEETRKEREKTRKEENEAFSKTMSNKDVPICYL